MTALLILIFALGAALLLATRCRRGHPGLKDLEGWNYAHRGLHGPGCPENSMAAFRASLARGYGIELDVHLLKDGQLAVIHDSRLKRTTGREGIIEDCTAEDLPGIFLEGTQETVPLFRQVLELYDGKAPLIVELKPVGNNHARLSRTVCDLLESYQGVYCLESFDPRCVAWIRKNRPHLIRGQLTENFLETGSHMPWILRFLMTHNLLNFLSVPDFVSYKYADRNYSFTTRLCRKLWKVQGVTWTLKTMEQHRQAVKEGWIPIFEDYTP